MTAILEWVDPSRLPPSIRTTLVLLGPFLASGLTFAEIGSRLEPRRSEDWVAARVRDVRVALAREALARPDGMPRALRERLQALLA